MINQSSSQLEAPPAARTSQAKRQEVRLRTEMRARSRERRKVVPEPWRDLLASLPGFDPYALAEGCWFNEKIASQYIRFFEKCLTHVEGELAGQPFILEEWQQATIANLFGWYRKDERGREVRRFRKMFFYVPRKNGKTPFVAGICLAVMVLDNEPGAQVYGFAADVEQAALMYHQATGMVHNEPELSSRLEIYKATGQRAIVYPEYRSSYKVVSGDAKGKHGRNPHFVAVDELHEQPNRTLIDTIETSFASLNRKQPLLIYLTTADYDREESICNEKLELAKNVRDNPGDKAMPGYDPTLLPVIYEARRDDDWTDPVVWARVNPNLDVSVSRNFLEDQCREARENAAIENNFKRLHLNMRTEQAFRWMPMDAWDRCDDDVDESLLAGRECFGGLDLASKNDTASFMLVFPPDPGDDLWRVLTRVWIPQEAATRDELKKSIPYSVWASNGLITICSGSRIEYQLILDQMSMDAERYELVNIGADPWNLEHLRQTFDPEGMKIVEARQGMRTLSAPMKELKALVESEAIAHGGHPVLRWQMGNVAADEDKNLNIMPNKRKSSSKIDAPVSLIMAVGMAMLREEPPPTAYDGTRGVMVI